MTDKREIQQQSLYKQAPARGSAPKDHEELSSNAVLDDPELLASEAQRQDPSVHYQQQMPSVHFGGEQIQPNTIKIISLEGHEIEQPYRITQMCRRINAKIFRTDIKQDHLALIVDYCEQMHYVKNTTTLQFPLSMNNLEDNTGAVQEMQYIKEYVEDFQSLKELMRAAKTLGTEAFYQLCAAAIASWFRRKTMRDVNRELGLERPG
jgi:REP element-mobilizing transposase RayT